jgi:orotate phosphoribosyltransferase-like protein
MASGRVTSTIRDLYVEALALKQEGLSAFEVAHRLKAEGYEAGYTTIDVLVAEASGQHIEVSFEGYGRIWFDGAEWSWKTEI